MKRALALVAVFAGALVACELAPVDVEGLRCDDARPCGAGFECQRGVCVVEGTVDDAGVDAGFDAGVDAGTDAGADAGTDAGFDAGLPRGVNLLENPGFETIAMDGGPFAWRQTVGRLTPFSFNTHNGMRAMRISSTGSQQQIGLVPSTDVEGPELGMLFCGSIWVRAEGDAGVDVTLTIRDRFFDGGIATSNGTRLTVTSTWTQLKEEYAAIGNSTMQLRLGSNSRFDGGEGYVVDDAWLSVAVQGVCQP